MKKILLLIIASLAFVSCSNSLESKARKQMEKTMLEMAKNPESVKIDNVKTNYQQMTAYVYYHLMQEVKIALEDTIGLIMNTTMLSLKKMEKKDTWKHYRK